jgi:CheY-like chemotaxis protein
MKSRTRNTLIVDDEPEYLEWLSEYLRAKGFYCDYAPNLNEAHAKLSANRYQLVVVDLTIPVIGGPESVLDQQEPVFREFPGLMAARFARNRGQSPGSVIVYSVHRDARVAQIADGLGIRYRLKGRPRDFKADVDAAVRVRPPKKAKATAARRSRKKT